MAPQSRKWGGGILAARKTPSATSSSTTTTASGLPQPADVSRASSFPNRRISCEPASSGLFHSPPIPVIVAPLDHRLPRPHLRPHTRPWDHVPKAPQQHPLPLHAAP